VQATDMMDPFVEVMTQFFDLIRKVTAHRYLDNPKKDGRLGGRSSNCGAKRRPIGGQDRLEDCTGLRHVGACRQREWLHDSKPASTFKKVPSQLYALHPTPIAVAVGASSGLF